MPELPEVETTRRGIAPHIEQRKVTGVSVRESRLRWPVDSKLEHHLLGHKLKKISRRGKYLLLEFNHGCLLAHLGMSGSLRIVSTQEPIKKHDHVDIAFGNQLLRYHDPRRFGSLIWTTEPPYEHKLLAKLGPEPLTDEFNADYLFSKSRKREKSVKEWIMDSHLVVGVGNIYANESLFMAGIRPTKSAKRLTRQECQRWLDTIKLVLERSIAQGGTTLRDFVGSDGKPGYFKQQLAVYGRGGEPCSVCTKPLKDIRQSNRATVYCTACQK